MRSQESKQEQKTASSRNTIQRALVLDAVQSLCNHPTSSDVYEVVREHHPHISRATVYRNLDVLASKGDISRIEVPNGAARYDIPFKPHYHMKCKSCGMIFDADMPYLDDLSTRLGDTRGFLIEGHQIMFEGLCPECQLNHSVA